MSDTIEQSLSAEEIQSLTGIDSATIANAIEKFNVRDPTEGYSSFELRCMFPELPPIVGYAVTCTDDSTSPYRQNRRSRDKELYEAIRDTPEPTIVVIKNVGPDRLRSNHFGDVMATTFQRLGVVACVTDGGVRDLQGMKERAPGFQVFAPGAVVSHGFPVVVEVGITVTVCGLTVSPGDLLHGDANGIVSIPHSVADKVGDEALNIIQAERERIEFLKGPEFTLEEFFRRKGW